MKVLLAFGTRPEAIKFAPVYHELMSRSSPAELEVVVCITAQHRHMLDQVLELFDIPADYDLDVMVDNQTPTQVAAAVMNRLEPILHHEDPEWVLVQGDTITTAAAALTAFFARMKIGHIEAGFRCVRQNRRRLDITRVDSQIGVWVFTMRFPKTYR